MNILNYPVRLSLVVLSLLVSNALSATTIPLDKLSHIHGIATHSTDPKLYLATHDGLFLLSANGEAEQISKQKNDLMSFARHPTNVDIMYASGHPVGGKGNLGFLQSKDAGRTWKQLSPGVSGSDSDPADFHALTVSRANPKVIYGIFQGLQVSRDAGHTWKRAGDAPPKIFNIAASAHDTDTLYAATKKGLLISEDGGRTWSIAHMFLNPVSTVRVSADGTVYAFMVGKGLLRSNTKNLEWKLVNNQLGFQVFLDIAVSEKDANKMYALTQFGKLLASTDAGKSWHAYTGDRKPTTKAALRGEGLYKQYCQTCHGVRGIGETFTTQALNNSKYTMAPALDDSMHTWHHTDEAIVKTILEGIKRNKRMPAWKGVLSEKDARDVVAYIKSLWSERTLSCQGPKHMSCM